MMDAEEKIGYLERERDTARHERDLCQALLLVRNVRAIARANYISRLQERVRELEAQNEDPWEGGTP